MMMKINPATQNQALVYSALKFLTEQVNDYLLKLEGVSEGENIATLKLSPIVDQQGKLKFDKLAMTLLAIEEERVNKAQSPYFKFKENNGTSYKKINPQIKLNLTIMLTSNFINGDDGCDGYDEALKFLSYVIFYFQGINVFDKASNDQLPEGIQKLIVDLIPKSLDEFYQIWSMIGA